jgi:hypothetical protein
MTQIPEYEGPPEPDWFECGYCSKKILTLWAPNHCGMLRGDGFCLMGDEVWHDGCVDQALEEHPLNENFP